MISIQKHMQDQMSAATTRKAYQKLLDGILKTTAEHMTSADDDSHDSFSKDLAQLVHRLKGQETAQDIEASSEAIVARLTSQWRHVESHIARRERELTGIISLLAETAGRLDHSNKNFYANIGHAVQTLEDIGKIDDISVLRRALSDHVSRLKNTVTSQEAFASEALAGMQDTLETAKTSIKEMSRLVSSDALESLPGRRHAEQFIAELTGKACPFLLGWCGWTVLNELPGDTAMHRHNECFSSSVQNSVIRSRHRFIRIDGPQTPSWSLVTTCPNRR